VIKKLLCKHRHTIETHPNCFVSEALDEKQLSKLAKERGIPWYQLPEYRIGYIDIETIGELAADTGVMVSWAIKEKGGEVRTDISKPKEMLRIDGEKRIIESLLNEMRRYKILVGYYSGSTHFDIPYIRAKALHYGLDFPEFGSIYHFDLYNIVKSRLKLRNNRLATVCEYLGITEKNQSPHDIEIWRRAKYGDPDALKFILMHNIEDVIATEKVHDKLQPFGKWTKTSI